MTKISDKELAAGLRQRKKPETIAAEVRETIVSQMHADAMRLPVEKISASPYQVRQITEQTIEDLMESIRDTGGLITPVVVRPLGELYELIAGHTRYLACVRLGYTEIPAMVRPMADAEAARALAADNLTRKDLADFEIFKQLNTLFAAGFLKSNSEASRLLGRSRQDIIRYQAYGQLPPEVIDLLDSQPDLIGAAAAKALLDYLPSRTDVVIEACRRLAAGRLKNQTATLAWIEQQFREKAIRQEQRVLDKAGATVGKIVWGESGLKLTGKTIDLTKVEAAIKKSLQDQGYRL
jgi:ParB family chromosome partitioning protein